jgi:hypothetical protein
MSQFGSTDSDRNAELEFDANGLRQLGLEDFPRLQLDRQHNIYFDRHKIQTASFVSLTKWQVVFGVVAAIAAIIAAAASTASAIWSGLYTDRYLMVTPAKPVSGETSSQNDILAQVTERSRQDTERRLLAIESTLRELQISHSVESQTNSNLQTSLDRLSSAVQSIVDKLPANTAPKSASKRPHQ